MPVDPTEDGYVLTLLDTPDEDAEPPHGGRVQQDRRDRVYFGLGQDPQVCQHPRSRWPMGCTNALL